MLWVLQKLYRRVEKIASANKVQLYPSLRLGFRLHKLDAKGEKEWERQYKVGKYNYGGDVLQTRAGGYIVAGYSDVGVWLLKLNPSGKYE